jgi:hypothetical protein
LGLMRRSWPSQEWRWHIADSLRTRGSVALYPERDSVSLRMLGRRNQGQRQLFYEFRLDEAVPDDHLVRRIASFVDLSWVYSEKRLAGKAWMYLAAVVARIGR